MIETLKKIFARESMQENRGLMILTIVVFLLALVAFSLGSKAVIDYRHAKEINTKMQEMQTAIADFKTSSDLVNKQEYRPIQADQVDFIQADIMALVTGHQLKMTDYQVANGDKKEGAYKSFEITVSGSYENTIMFLQNFHARDALMKIMEVSMSPDKDGNIETNLLYRVYTK